MREKLEMLLDELQYLKSEGVDGIYCEDSSLDALKDVVDQFNPKVASEVTADPSCSIDQTNLPPVVIPAKRLNPFSPLPESDKDRIAKSEKPVLIPITVPETKSQKLVLPKVQIDIVLPEGDKQTRWNFLHDKALNDPFIKAQSRPNTKLVFGQGDLDAEVFFCGDAPGPEEEMQGEPFVGPAGQLLTKIIQAMGLQRHNVYLANIMSWCPEASTPFGNRQPTQDEMNASLPYLTAQLEIVQPKVVVALGAMAVNGLLGIDKNRKMGEIRGQWFQFRNFPLMITFHPSYLIHNGTLRTKRLVWEDMLYVMERINLPISEKQRGFFK